MQQESEKEARPFQKVSCALKRMQKGRQGFRGWQAKGGGCPPHTQRGDGSGTPPVGAGRTRLSWGGGRPTRVWCPQGCGLCLSQCSMSLQGNPSKPALCARWRKHILESPVCFVPGVGRPPRPGVQRTGSHADHRISAARVGDHSGAATVRDMGSTKELLLRPGSPRSPSGKGIQLPTGSGRGCQGEGQGGA